MKPTLLLKYTVCYLLILLSSLTIMNTYGIRRIEKGMTDNKLAALRQEATLISENYMESYYRNTMTLTNLLAQLKTIDTFANARIWIVNSQGFIISDTRSQDPLQTSQLDPAFMRQDSSTYVQIDGLVDEPMISVVHPVNMNFELKGYIVLLSPLQSIRESCSYNIDTLNACLLMVSGIFFFAMAYLYCISIMPLRRAIHTAREYADGHLDYKPKKRHGHDEFQDLSDTIEYMGAELNRMDEYQKKFIANISHDFRSPLTSIKGYAEAMIDGTIPPELHGKYLNTICFETERLTKLTSGLLELNHFDSSHAMLDPSIFDLNQIIKRTAESFEGTCRRKRITLNLIFSGEQALVEADMGKIQQVLYNLIDNAIKFSQNDSSIDVSTYEKGMKMFVSVKDYGVGIPKDSLKRIWERFYKLDTSRGKDKKGTGLGLSIVKEIVNMHGENINVISTEGVGSEFIFTLPLVEDGSTEAD